MRLFLETWRLIRGVNCLMAMVGVWIGAHLAQGGAEYYRPYMAGLATFLVCAFGNIINDLIDIESDRINRPRRVLVREALSPGFAVGLAVASSLLAILLSMTARWEIVTMVVVAIGLLVAYNFRLKRIPVLGNIVVAVLGGLTLITGGLAVAPSRVLEMPGALLPALMAVPFHMVREIVKDVEDIAGDRQAGVVTLPQLIGVRPALTVAGVLFMALVGLTLVPIWAGWFGRAYEIIAVYVIDIPLIGLLICLWLRPGQPLLAVTSLALKFGMLMGIVALLVG
jgi:geranylgeranylglycerol-phosphate geranylgeranyltransferase